MTPNELERLIAMLEPNAEEDTVNFVRAELSKAVVQISTPPPRCVKSTDTGEVTPWNPNDPRNW